MAERLLGAGLVVQGFDIDPERRRGLTDLGGVFADSAAEAASGASVVLTCLLTPDTVREAVFGDDGAAGSMLRGSILVDLSTCGPNDSRRLAEELQARGISMLDAPVSGSSASVRAGAAVILVGGPTETFEHCLPLFATFGRKVIRVGPHGAGSTAKLVTNLVVGLNRLALAEGLALGLRAGIEGPALLAILREGAAHSHALDAKGQRMITGEFEPEARLSQHLKDVRLIKDLGNQLGATLPATTLHERLLADAVDRGLGDLDNSAVIALIQAMEG